ncbi:O-antigen ligase family protein [bacterium]|nr:O-antigen ligase family protein [bacterium]
MFLNSVLAFFQSLFAQFYKKSFVLKNLDGLIFINILCVILSAMVFPSDNIGYFAVFMMLLTIIKLFVKPNERFCLTKADKFLLIYFLLVLISVAGSTLLALSIKGFCKTIVYFGFYISFIHYLKDNRGKLKYILLTLAFAVFAESLIAIKQNFLSVSEISGWQDMSRLNPEQIMTRVYGTIKPYNPNLFGGYMLAILPTSLILVFLPLINKHYKTAALGFMCFLLGIATVLMTGCRGAYMGLFVQLLCTGLLTYKFLKPIYKKIFLTVSSIFSFLVFLFILSKASLRARILSIFAMRNDSSNSFRFNVYNSCIDMFKDNWLLGIGVGNQNFREIYGLYMKTGFDALSAYNIYLETAVESGLFALLAFLAFVGINFSKAINYIKRRDNIVSIYLAIAVISLIGILIHGFVDTVFFRPQIQFAFWIMIGIIRVFTTTWGIYDRKRN